MDWFTVVLIILFFILPVIQQVLEQARRKGAPPPPAEWEGVDPEVEQARRVEAPPDRMGTLGPVPDPGWSEGWTPWPAEGEAHQEEDSREAERIVWSPPARPVEVARPEPRPMVVEAPRAEVPADRPLLVPKRTGSARSGTALSQSSPPRILQAAPRRRRDHLGRLLTNQQEIRRAIVLREVLGPPLALVPVDRNHLG
jgi:hypothetical protein